jgi:membrane protein
MPKPSLVTNPLRAAWRLIVNIAHEYSIFDVPRLAAAMAYYAAASMAPMLVVVIAIVGFVLGSDEARQQLLQRVSATIGAEGVKLLDGVLSNITAPRRGLIATLASLGAILIGSTAFFAELQASLNTIWRVQPRQDGALRRVLLRRIQAFGIVIGISFCLTLSVLAGFVVNAAGGQLQRWVPASQSVLTVADSLLTLALVTVFFAQIFRSVPEKKLPWQNVFAGAALTSAMFVAGMEGISYYIAKAGVGSAYGAAGSLLVVLVWIYYSAQVFLIGAILTHLFASRL